MFLCVADLKVEVEVLRNHFHDEKPTEGTTFRHPRALLNSEVDKLHAHLPVSIEHATTRVQDQGKNAIDRLGLGLMRSNSSRTTVSPTLSRVASPEEIEPASHEEMEPETSEERRVVHIDPARLRKHKPTLRQRIFGRFGQGQKEDDLSDVEEGRAPVPAYISRTRSAAQPVPIIAEPEHDEDEADNPLRMSRTASKSIRFAPEASNSSDTAPGPSNYGSSAPGFKRNPELSMFRTTSVRSTEEGPSVSFREP